MSKDTSTVGRRLSLDEIVSFCRRRGFVYQSSEIYGGVNGFWDFGPLGVELKRNIKQAWWEDMVTHHNPLVTLPGAPGTYEITGLDSAIIQHPQTWNVSGHAELFSDTMVDCQESKRRYRYDHLQGRWIEGRDGRVFVCLALDAADADAWLDKRARSLLKISKKVDVEWDSELVDLAEVSLSDAVAPHASKPGTLTEPREFNLMFKTQIGAVEDNADIASLRPETAQGIFLNFRNIIDSGRHELPLGIAQIGKSFRNEITPRHFIFRSREFEQMEMEFFCPPETSMEWYKFWAERRVDWYRNLGLREENIQVREHGSDELSHYALGTTDIEYAYPFLPDGEFGELEGIANRGDFDLNSHSMGLLEKANPPTPALDENGKPRHRGSGKNMQYNDIARGEKYVPHVIEPAAGVDRAMLAFLCDALEIEGIGGDEKNERTLLRLHPRLAPVKAAIYPLVKKDGMPEAGRELFGSLKRRFNVIYDEKGSIGRRYRRADEIGVPVCITIDDQSVSEGTVTVRDRDSLAQRRVPIEECESLIAEMLHA
ncbi:MAG: glycine--tRNA ligase [Erythrobacter sp.]|nr:glycine--tRNA ligase [Erythrobacter sp.]